MTTTQILSDTDLHVQNNYGGGFTVRGSRRNPNAPIVSVVVNGRKRLYKTVRMDFDPSRYVGEGLDAITLLGVRVTPDGREVGNGRIQAVAHSAANGFTMVVDHGTSVEVVE